MEKELKHIIKDYLDANQNIFMPSRSKSVMFDFSHVSKFSIDISEQLLDNPTETISIFNKILEESFSKKIKARFFNLPESQKLNLWEIRSELNKFIKVSGFLIKSSEIITIPSTVFYECNQCATVIPIERHEEDDFVKLPEPKKCACGSKSLRLLKRELTHYKKLIIEEDSNIVTDKKIPKRKMVLLKDDLTTQSIDKKIEVGIKVCINGILKLKYTNKKESDEMDTYISANSIEFVEVGWDVVYKNLNDKEIKQIKELSKKENIIEFMGKWMIPDIHKNERAKEALFLMLCGAKNIYDKKGSLRTRGTMHIGLVGSPSAGKTYLATATMKYSPIYRFTSATTSTGRGLIATVVQDKEIGAYALESGVVVTCNKGLVVVDELDKLPKEEYGHFNNFMNDLKVTIDKATIHATLDTDTSLLATLNPEGRSFITGVSLSEQIALPKDLLDRFDLMIPTHRLKEEGDQREIIRININKRKPKKDIKKEVSDDMIKNYISFARSIEVEFPDELDEVIENAIIKFTRPTTEKEQEISHRIYEVILRFIEASARAHLRKKANLTDVKYAIELKRWELSELGLLDNKGIIRYDTIEGIDEGKANDYILLKRLFRDNSDKEFTIEEVVYETKTELEKVEELITKMKNVGDIFEPVTGRYKFIG